MSVIPVLLVAAVMVMTCVHVLLRAFRYTAIDVHGSCLWCQQQGMLCALVAYLGLPASSPVVPFNIVNATVAYAVEDVGFSGDVASLTWGNIADQVGRTNPT